jgi:hypothetical protein
LGLNWDYCWDDLKGLFGAETVGKRRLISVKQLCYTPTVGTDIHSKALSDFLPASHRVFWPRRCCTNRPR